MEFQFTRPQEARRRFLPFPGRWHGFNSRARKRRDMTTSLVAFLGRSFNSRARKRRDHLFPIAPGLTGRFNSRARKRRDRAAMLFENRICVSIHAPARGATDAGQAHIWDGMFQFTRPQEARLLIRRSRLRLLSFQFTRPQEARLQRLYELDARGGFNSRARKRRDGVSRQGRRSRVFQFTRPQEARPSGGRSIFTSCSFNSRARKRRDLTQ